MKTYTNRSNAKRAAIASGIPESEVELTVHKVAGEKPQFGFKRKETGATAPAKAAGKAQPAPASAAPATPRDKRNGVCRPRAGGACAAVWAHLDKYPESKLAGVRAWAEKHDHNVNNAMIEFYRWRKFNAQEVRRAA